MIRPASHDVDISAPSLWPGGRGKRGASHYRCIVSGSISEEMTCHLVVSIHLLQDWLNLRTDRFGKRTAGVKAAARGRVQRTRDFAGNDDLFTLFVWV